MKWLFYIGGGWLLWNFLKPHEGVVAHDAAIAAGTQPMTPTEYLKESLSRIGAGFVRSLKSAGVDYVLEITEAYKQGLPPGSFSSPQPNTQRVELQIGGSTVTAWLPLQAPQ